MRQDKASHVCSPQCLPGGCLVNLGEKSFALADLVCDYEGPVQVPEIIESCLPIGLFSLIVCSGLASCLFRPIQSGAMNSPSSSCITTWKHTKCLFFHAKPTQLIISSWHVDTMWLNVDVIQSLNNDADTSGPEGTGQVLHDALTGRLHQSQREIWRQLW